MPVIEQIVTIKQIHEEVLKTREESKPFIEASETRLLLEVKNLIKNVEGLVRENLQVKTEVENVKRGRKKNGILIFGLGIWKIKMLVLAIV